MQLKRIFQLFFLFMTLLMSNLTLAQSTDIDRIAAIVNDDVITQTQVNDEVKLIQVQLRASGQPVPAFEKLSQEILQKMIDFKLQVQIAENNHVTIGDKELNQTIANLAKSNKLTVKQFKQRLASQNINYKKYRERLHQQLLASKLQQDLVSAKIKITDADITRYIQKHPNVSGVKYQVYDLLLATDGLDANEKNILNTANKLKTRAAKGSSFKGLAFGSDDAENIKFNDLGWRTLSDLPTVFAEKVKTMKKGQVMGPIKTSNGFHIIKLVATSINKDGAQDKMLRQRVHNLIFQERSNTEIQAWLKDIREQSFVKTL